MTSDEEETQDLLNIIADNPVVFNWKGADYQGFCGKLMRNQENSAGGYLDDPDLSIVTTRKTGSPALMDWRFANNVVPAIGDKFTIGAKIFRIDSIALDKPDPLGIAIQFNLIGPNKGA